MTQNPNWFGTSPFFARSNSGASSIDSSSASALLAADCVIDIALEALCSDLWSSSAISNCNCFMRKRLINTSSVDFIARSSNLEGESQKRSPDGKVSLYSALNQPL